MVTILISAKPQLPTPLYRNIYSLVGREAKHLVDAGFEVNSVIETSSLKIPEGTTHAVRAKVLQKHRDDTVQKLIPAEYFTHEDFVLFVDADIINCTESTFLELVMTCWRNQPHSVAAPLVLLEATGTSRVDRWYDTAGFIHNGERAALFPPYFSADVFSQAGINPYALPLPLNTEEQPVLRLNGSVGCVYCANATLFAPDGNMPIGFEGTFDPMFTEHYPLCQNARQRGGEILVRADLVATHAYLPLYGERFH